MAVAWSSHPDAATATGEVAGAIIEALDGSAPTLLWVAATPGYLPSFADIVSGLRAVLRPGLTIGSTVRAVLGRGPVEPSAPVGALAVGAYTTSGADLTPRRISTGSNPPPEPTECRIAFAADGSTLPAGSPTGTVVFAAAAGRRGRPGLVALDDEVSAVGVVAIDIGALASPRIDVVPALVPLGPELTVTDARGPALRGLGGRAPAALVATALGLEGPIGPDLTDRLLVGIVDGPGPEPEIGDLQTLRVLGSDPASGTFTVERDIAVGDGVRLLLHDPGAAHPAIAATTSSTDRHTLLAAGPDVAVAGSDDPVSAITAAGAAPGVIGAQYSALTVSVNGTTARTRHAFVMSSFATDRETGRPAGAT